MSTPETSRDVVFRLARVHQRKRSREILRDVTLAVSRGRITVLLGPSGSGKTSLLRLLNRLDDPAGGDITYEGQPIDAYPVTRLRREVGFVSQTPVMFPGTVADNLSEAAEISEIPADTLPAVASRAVQLVELGESFLDREAAELSVGQQQRVNLARTLISEPRALLLDEPTSALDVETAASLLNTVRRLSREEGLTVLLSTHRLEEAREMGDHAVLLRDGIVENQGAAGAVVAGVKPLLQKGLD